MIETPEEIARRLVRCLCPVIPPLGGEHATYCIIPSVTLALAAERERAERKEEEARVLWGRVQSLEERRKVADEIIDDNIARFSYLCDVWRDAQSNEDVANGLRSFLVEWPKVREQYIEAHSVLSTFRSEAADLAQRLTQLQQREGELERVLGALVTSEDAGLYEYDSDYACVYCSAEPDMSMYVVNQRHAPDCPVCLARLALAAPGEGGEE